jgi:hypothetical protein
MIVSELISDRNTSDGLSHEDEKVLVDTEFALIA